MKCPKCNFENNDDVISCVNCGNILNNTSSSNFVFDDIRNNPNYTTNVQVAQPIDQLVNNNTEPVNATLNNSDIKSQVVSNEVNIDVNQNNLATNEVKISKKVVEVNTNQTNNTKKTKKGFFLDFETILIILLCIFAVYAAFKFIPEYLKYNNYNIKLGNNINLSYLFDPDRPVLYKNDEGKYIYLKSTGGNLIDKSYEYATDFYGDYALVNADYQNEDYSTYKYNLINKKGKIMFKIKDLDLYYNDQENNVYLIDGVLYDSRLKQITPSNYSLSFLSSKFYKYYDNDTKKSGIMNIKGEVIYELKNDLSSYSIHSKRYSTTDYYLEIRDVVDGVVSCKFLSLANDNKVVFEIDNIEGYTINYSQGLIEYYKDEDSKNYVLLSEGSKIYEIKNILNASLQNGTTNILSIYENENSSYYYDANNKKKYDILPSELEYDDYLSQYGYTISRDEETNKVGLINSSKKLVVPKSYDNIIFLNLELYLFIQNRTHSDIFILENYDSKTITVYDAKYDKVLSKYSDTNITLTSYSTFIYFTNYDKGQLMNRVVYNLLTNKELELRSNEEIKIYENYIYVKNSKFEKLYNTKFVNFNSKKLD